MKKYKYLKTVNKVAEVKDLQNNFDYFLRLKTKLENFLPDLCFYLDRYVYKSTFGTACYYVKEIDNIFKSLFMYLSIKDVKKYYEIKVDLYNYLLDFSIFVDKQEHELQSFLKDKKETKSKIMFKNKQKFNNKQK